MPAEFYSLIIFAAMENFIVSARKYRPQNFEEVVGQGHVTRTLDNAIKQNHLAQALLFTGPRGVGKTTCARILAKKINADGQDDADQDFSFNIFELDAASNNSVDDIRSLIDQVRFAPQVGKYKVYIIDEVHMLSQAAFNAFLKTLEEPPAHAIFILATTEKHKIIPTILSRCQIFDFKRITVEDIAGHIRNVADQESISAQEEALRVIAQKADGALRDALSIFDRIVSFSGNNITYKDVIENLRILDYDYYFRTTDYIVENNGAGLLNILSEILDKGFDAHIYIAGLASHFRDLLVCQDPSTIELIETGPEIQKRYQDQAQRVNTALLLEGLKLLTETDYRYKGSSNPRLLVEITLLQLGEMYSPEKKNSNSGVKPAAQAAPRVQASAPATPIVQNKSQPQAAAPIAKQIQEKPRTETKLPPALAFGGNDDIPSTPSAEATPNIANRKRSGRKRLSISGAFAEEEQEEEVTTEKRQNLYLPKDEFTQNELENQWREYLEDVKKSGKQRVYSSFINKKPELTTDFTANLLLDNEIQHSYFEEEKSTMLQFLQKRLNNYSLSFNISIAESARQLDPYTADEKFQYMAEKNPNLVLLRQKFDLDIE